MYVGEKNFFYFRLPGYINFSDPESEGLPGSRNFYLESEPGVKLGVWQILPADIQVLPADFQLLPVDIQILPVYIQIIFCKYSDISCIYTDTFCIYTPAQT